MSRPFGVVPQVLNPKLRPEDRTHPLIWLIAIVCALLAIAVILTGLVIFIVYIIYQPRLPYLVITDARLIKLDYDQSGLLDSSFSLSLSAENDNRKADASFSDLSVKVRFHGLEIADLRADDFSVARNSSVALNYVVPTAVPLDEGGMEEMDASLRRDMVRFAVDGKARTRWRVGWLLSVKFWTHLSCHVQFFVSNKTNTGLDDCTSKSHSL